jgi:hypothetical protein
MLSDRLFIATQTFDQPIASCLAVGHRFQGREGFGRNDEQGLRRVEIVDGFREVCAVDIGNKAKRHSSLAVVLECLVGHYRPEVGAADADVDDVANALAGVTLP